MKRAVAVFMAAAVVFVLAPPAFATHTYPPAPQPTCRVSDRTVFPGQEVRVGGRNWKPNDVVAVGFKQDNGKRKLYPTDANGDFMGTFQIPGWAQPGGALMGCRGPDRAGHIREIFFPVRVHEEPQQTVSTSPAGITTWMAVLALAIAASGLALVRRRRMRQLVG